MIKSVVKADFSAILSQRHKTALHDMQQMNKIKEELDFNKLLQEELTGKSNDDEETETTRAKIFVDNVLPL